ncbi:MAG: helix-turn-helix transcriptional regulator [Acaryochloris sp. CRU_2_0]|nr:helix-turn-helix transcriptional regulator [Acaryochloris sp. CRU_2_0]
MLNRIKEFLDNRPDPLSGSGKTTPYRFWQESGIGRDTAYRMYNDPTYIPGSGALSKICVTYGLQPGDFLIYRQDE